MRKQLLLITALVACFTLGASAQVRLSVNIGAQPLWGPVGYDHASYYYFPDIDAYYDVAAQQYVYMDGGVWATRPSLPPRYAGFDLYHSYKAVINEPRPWMHAARYRTKYAHYKGRHDQGVIRDSHEDKYRAIPGHPEHNMWHGNAHQPRQVQPRQQNMHQDHGGHPGGGHDGGGHGGHDENGGHHDHGGH